MSANRDTLPVYLYNLDRSAALHPADMYTHLFQRISRYSVIGIICYEYWCVALSIATPDGQYNSSGARSRFQVTIVSVWNLV